MKAILKSILILTLFVGFNATSNAQMASSTFKLNLGKVQPYPLEVTYNKTSHLIFPAAIRYVDLGSDYLVAGKAEGAENVLRIKAAIRDFPEETNFTVITDDGRFYNFNVTYSPYPGMLSYNLLTMQKSGDRENNDVLLEELGDSPPSLTALLMETIHKRDRRAIKHIGSRSYGIRFLLEGIYVQDGKFYFHTELRNRTNVPFVVDFITFKIVDKKVAKRTVIQERPIHPLRVYKPLDKVAGSATAKNVYLLDQFTIADDKVLLIEIFEKNGGRGQVLQVENSDLVHAKPIRDMHLKIN